MSIVSIVLAIAIMTLGIVALSTSTWLVLNDPSPTEKVYSLFERCDRVVTAVPANHVCRSLENFSVSQILNITGMAMIGVGNILAIALAFLTKSHSIPLVSQVFLMSGPTLLLLGCLFYIRSVLKNYTADTVELSLGYSFILLLMTCILGYISSSYFIFTTLSLSLIHI